MQTLYARVATRLAVALAGLAVVAAVPVALGADSSSLRARATALRAQDSSTAARAQAAVLTLYALETEVATARADAAAADARRASVGRERSSTRRQLAAARSSMRASERRLAELVRRLYEQNGTDPLAILLGAGSLDEALTGLDNLSRAAGENSLVLTRTRAARGRLARLDARLGRREAELRRVSGAALAHAQALEALAAERAAYVAALRRQQGLNARKVAVLEAQAQTAERTSASLTITRTAASRVPSAQATASTAPSAARSEPAPTPSAGTLTVSATGYSLPGRTASGLPVGPGIVAVDPSVIPLGTRMYIPGYGDAVAADTGGAVQGATIDLWFATTAAALQWGRRTVTITLR